MSIVSVIQALQIFTSIVLIAVILIQQKGAGMGAGFGGGSGPIVHTKRGVDLFLHRATIVIAIVFFALAVARIFV
ncbi:MAG: preprotein translocase subunit SecG [Candidatus Magasanikbacteria bacterium CG10_big_fil_rev_8_21_14_0_10_47_10]|uniref:Protein-export membrane protein SecG n=1 Tax=Candidatus Magasanikbacteria bacterium CG10_big_fil_rev_8_21_14_0_10_47_10 TaxID=1974652 RepID=A0A2H0TQ13_9BACT|nr:MAG: preprotein translocase subunit SecG [Candidatus Magasanikbacteria bacterium CG10_big_fil_rev_8_21_14_0_10_47_10]